jgi:hypothetical protein
VIGLRAEPTSKIQCTRFQLLPQDNLERCRSVSDLRIKASTHLNPLVATRQRDAPRTAACIRGCVSKGYRASTARSDEIRVSTFVIRSTLCARAADPVANAATEMKMAPTHLLTDLASHLTSGAGVPQRETGVWRFFTAVARNSRTRARSSAMAANRHLGAIAHDSGTFGQRRVWRCAALGIRTRWAVDRSAAQSR